MIEEIFDDRAEQLDVAAANCATRNEVDDFAQRGILFVVIARTIAARLHLRDLGGGQAKEEEVLCADFLADFDIRAVERANGERAVERKLHVARAAGFLARGGDLLG